MPIVKDPKDDGIVLDEEMADKMFTKLSPSELPDVEELSSRIEEIIECMCDDDMFNLSKSDYPKYTNEMKKKFPEFSEKYSSIFEMVISGKDITPLIEMLAQIDSIKKGKKTMQQAEDELRDSLAEQFVYPNLSAKQRKDVENYMKKNNKK